VELPAGSATSKTIDGDKRVIFGLQFPTPGLGKAEIFIDRPAADTSASPTDPYLADTIAFLVETGTQSTQPPTRSTPTATPYPQTALPTPTPHP
jgi:hypothetical protein